MKTKMILISTVLLFSSFMFPACVTTKLTAVWKNDNVQPGQIKKIAVLGVLPKADVRNTFEDIFVRELKARGLDAVQAYTVLPHEKLMDRVAVVSALKNMGTDAVIITRLLDRKMVETYTAPDPKAVDYARSTMGAYAAMFAAQGQTATNEFSYHETNVYRTDTEQLLWTARSETWIGDFLETLIKSGIGVIVSRLSSDGIIK